MDAFDRMIEKMNKAIRGLTEEIDRLVKENREMKKVVDCAVAWHLYHDGYERSGTSSKDLFDTVSLYLKG